MKKTDILIGALTLVFLLGIVKDIIALIIVVFFLKKTLNRK